MEDKILRNLIELYRAKGISFEHLLRNDTFLELPTEAKIRLIKEHASELSDGVKFDSGDVKYLLKTVGSVALAGAMLTKAYFAAKAKEGSNPILATVLTAGSSVPLNKAFTNINNLRADMNRKSSVRSYLTNTTDSDAVKLMAQLGQMRIKKGL